MNTLLKFTFIYGILILFLLELVIIYFVYRLGNRQYKKDYEKDYKYLKLLIEDSNVNDSLIKQEIKRRFDEISTYRCKNYEKLQVLEKEFIQKFKNSNYEKV